MTISQDKKPTFRTFQHFYDNATTMTRVQARNAKGCLYCNNSGHRVLVLAGDGAGDAKPLLMDQKSWKYRPGYICTTGFPCDCDLGRAMKASHRYHRELSEGVHEKYLKYYAIASTEKHTSGTLAEMVIRRLQALPLQPINHVTELEPPQDKS